MRVRANPTAGLPALWMLLMMVGAWPAAAQQPVDLELVLAIDISGSVDEEEAALQREGYVSALTNPRVIAAMGGGPFGAIAVTYVEWAGEDYQRMVVPWTLIGTGEQAASFAQQIEAAPFASARWTSLSGAIDYSATLFDGNGFEGVRQVIDISGDGVNNRGRPPVLARDQAVEQRDRRTWGFLHRGARLRRLRVGHPCQADPRDRRAGKRVRLKLHRRLSNS